MNRTIFCIRKCSSLYSEARFLSVLLAFAILCNFVACSEDSPTIPTEILALRLIQSSSDSNAGNSGENSSAGETTGEGQTRDLKVFCNYESKYIHKDAVVTFTSTETGVEISVGTSSDSNATEPDSWAVASTYTFTSTGTVKLFATITRDGSTIGKNFDFTYEVVDQYPIDTEESISKDDSSLIAWADGHVGLSYGADVADLWKTPAKAYGSATGNNMDIVSLGNHGEITLTFSSGIKNGSGFDFVVFENAFESGGSGKMFAELAYIEVSSDGTNFLRFDNVSRTPGPVGGYGALDMRNIYGYAGQHPNAYGTSKGTPFDLDWLRNKEKVVNGMVDLNNIFYVKIVDISGAPDDSEAPTYYPSYDSFDTIIHDAYKTWGSGGFDLEAVGVIHNAN
ncbi:MAG: hypothetical protein AAF518_21775 [Spirochaetota bacterium]